MIMNKDSTYPQAVKDLDFAHDMVVLNQKSAHVRLQEQPVRVGLKVHATKTKQFEDLVPRKCWKNQLCRRDQGAGNRFHRC